MTGPLAGPLTVSWLEFRSVEGLHPPGIFNSNEKRIRPSAAVRKRSHFGDWPVYNHLSPTDRVARFAAVGKPYAVRVINPASGHFSPSGEAWRSARTNWKVSDKDGKP